MSATGASVAISARGIGKRYSLRGGRERSSLIDRVARTFSRDDDPFGDPEVWALRDVSFEIPRGRVVGVLGRNGSGKTTLVRILSRVTSPTEGRAVVNGRVGALFQAGAGFHPELSGRENIGLSGTVLGMTKEATAEAYDAIVAFAEIGDYLDAPVKFYSSGMYQRLAFAVSAHLDAEIMLIDEALSVGDLQFQEKCQAHIRNMVRDGRTVMYVSHGLEAMRAICDGALVLDAGRLRFEGGIDDGIAFYRDLNKRSHGPGRAAA